MERVLQSNPEKEIQSLVDRLEIREEIHYEFYDRGPWYKQYGNTYDPDGEYVTRLVEESVNGANEAKRLLLELGNKQPKLLPQILAGLLNKQLPPDDTHYVISTTETGFQRVEPEPSEERGMSWISVPETRKMIEDTVLGFGAKAVPYLETRNSKKSRDLAAKIKRQEFTRKIKKIFTRS